VSSGAAGLLAGVAAAVLGGAALGYAGERAVMTRERGRLDPAAGDDFAPPADAVHRTIPMDDGGSLHAVERGEGRPLVLLHGVTLSTDVWHYQLVDLASEFRVLAFDHRGHGRSTAGHEGTTMHRMAADAAAGLVALDVRDAIVVGHSMGGMVLQHLVLAFPELVAERIAGLVLLATTPRPAPQLRIGPVLAGAFLPAARRGLGYAARVPGAWLPSNDLSYLFMRMGFGSRPSPSHVELTRTIQAATAPSTVADLLEHLFDFDVLDDVGRIDLPTRVVVGERDLLTPPRIARALARRIPGAELTVLPGCGHMVMLERRRQLNDLLVDFSRRVEAP
jgi:pimeloyl-ACP methyl ester carboxylesterase